MGKVFQSVLIVFFLFVSVASAQNVRTSVTAVTVNPSQTNQYGEYQISYRVTNGNGQILAGRDSVHVTFPNGTNVPSLINASSISFGGIEVAGTARVIGQQVRFVAPKNVMNGETAIIRFSTISGIRNPSTVGNRTLTVYSTSSSINNGNGNVSTTTTNATVTSPSYSITQSNTTVSAASVTPNPSVALFPASYTISFQLGLGGFLELDDKIYIEFPVGTIVPQGFLSGITVNGTNAVALANGRILELFAPSFYDNLQFVQVIIPRSSGMRNPGPDLSNPYRVSVRTDSEPNAVLSTNYNISNPDQLSFSAILATPDTVNAAAAYQVSFYTGNPGALTANTDFIELTFPPNTTLPATINSARITISNSEGFSDNPSSVVRVSDTQIRLRTPLDIASATEVTISFQQNLGIKNPSHPGSYVVNARTIRPDNSVINNTTASNPYALFAAGSSIDRPIVSVAGQNYTITFNTGEKGGLAAGLNKINLTFPSAIGAISSATMNGTTIAAGNRVINGNSVSITVPAGVNVGNNSKVTLVLNGLTNPANGTYSIVASTSAEPNQIISSDYTLGGTSFTINSAPNINPQGVNQIATYEIYGLSGSGNYLRGNNDFIRFIFPEGVVLPDEITLAQIQTSINNGGNVSSIETNKQNRSVTLYLEKSAAGQPNQTFQVSWVKFLNTAGIRNPSIASTGVNNPANNTINTNNFRILVSSSRNPNYAQTPTFNIQPSGTNLFTVDEVSVSPNVRNASNVALTIKFTPDATIGKLIGGSSLGTNYLRLDSYSGFKNFPASFNPALVTINGVSLQRVDRNSNTQMTMFLPDGLVLEPGVQAEIRILGQNGLSIVNNGTSGSIALKADVEYSSRTGNFTYTAAQGTIPTVFEEMIPSNNTVNAPTAYTLRLNLGTNNPIAIDDVIKVTFPENTFVPNSIAASRIKVNGLSPNTDVVLNGTRTIDIVSPVAISAGSPLTILLSSTTGILNPSLVRANYTASVTLPGNVTINSPSYATTATLSTTSIATVQLSKTGVVNPSAPSIQADYTIRFGLGDFGRLYSGSTFSRSSITFQFPNTTGIPTAANAAITVNGVLVPQADRTMNNTTKTVTVLVPQNLATLNNSQMTVVIPNITNPSVSSNAYTMRVSTSVETASVESNTYAITNNGPVEFISATNVNNLVNQNSNYVIRFRANSAMTANVDRLIFEFPEDTGFRGAVADDAIEYEVFQDPGFTTSMGVSSFATPDLVISPNSNTITGLISSNIPGGSYIELRITEASLIRNPREPGSEYSFRVATTQQPFRVGTVALEFLPSLVTNITNLSVERSTSALNTPTTWTWRFTTGSNGGLRPGLGKITLRYLNSSIAVPATINTATMLFNQSRPTHVSVNGRDITITVPNSVSINSGGEVEIVISGDAGIVQTPPSGMNGDVVLKAAAPSNDSKPSIADSEYEAFTSSEPNEQGDNSSLPVELVSFNVRMIEELSPSLEWITATEIDNYGFRIDRKKGASDWSYLSFVEGNGYSTETIKYSYTDRSTSEAGNYFYRLTQIDFDGTETQFPEVEVQVLPPNETSLAGNFPNPFNPTTTISYQLANKNQVEIQVYDVLGRLVQTLVNEQQLAGKYAVQFNATRFSSGVYLVRMRFEGKEYIKKMLLVK